MLDFSAYGYLKSAIDHGDEGKVQSLIDGYRDDKKAQASMNSIKYGKRLLDHAFASRNENIIKIMLQNLDVNVLDPLGKSAIVDVIYESSDEFRSECLDLLFANQSFHVENLVKHKALDVKKLDVLIGRKGVLETLLLAAAKDGHKGVVTHILSTDKIDQGFQNPKKLYSEVFNQALFNEHFDIAEDIIQHARKREVRLELNKITEQAISKQLSSLTNLKNPNEIKKGLEYLNTMLLYMQDRKYQSGTPQSTTDAVNKFCTFIHQTKNEDIKSLAQDVLTKLIDTGQLDLETKSKDGDTLLHHTIKLGDQNLALHIINSKQANMESVDKDGKTALQLATEHNLPKAKLALIQLGANSRVTVPLPGLINSIMENHVLIFDDACDKDQDEILIALIEHKDFDIKHIQFSLNKILELTRYDRVIDNIIKHDLKSPSEQKLITVDEYKSSMEKLSEASDPIDQKKFIFLLSKYNDISDQLLDPQIIWQLHQFTRPFEQHKEMAQGVFETLVKNNLFDLNTVITVKKQDINKKIELFCDILAMDNGETIKNNINNNQLKIINIAPLIAHKQFSLNLFEDIMTNVMPKPIDKDFLKQLSIHLIDNNQTEKLNYLLKEKYIDGDLLNDLHINPFKILHNNHLDVLQLLIQHNVLFGNNQEKYTKIKDQNGNNLLHLACIYQLPNFTSFLLEQEVDQSFIHDINKQDFTPLMCACSFKSQHSTQIMDQIINHKNFKYNVENKDKNHILFAYYANGVELALHMMDNKKITHFENSLKSLLQRLASTGNTKDIESIINQHPKQYQYCHDIMATLLSKGHYDTLLQLIDNKHTNVNQAVYQNKSILQCSYEYYASIKEENPKSPHLDKIKSVIQRLILHPDIDINSTSLGMTLEKKPIGESLLRMVCRDGNHEILESLLVHPKMDINAGGCDKKGNNFTTPLAAAYEAQQFGIVETLLTKAKELDLKIDPNAKLSNGTPLAFQMYLDAGLEASPQRNLLNLLFTTPGYDPNAKNEIGNTLLMQACMRGDLDLAKKLFTNNLDIGAKNNAAQSALLLAAAGNHIELVKFFCDPSVNQYSNINDVDQSGNTALLYAYANGNKDMVKLLEEMGAKSSPSITSKNRLMAVSNSGNYDFMMEILTDELKNDSSIINKKDVNGNTALHFATLNHQVGQHQEIFKELIEKGADINAKGSNRSTPLMIAIINNDIEKVKFLLSKGADLNAKDNHGNTALILACTANNKELIELLVKDPAIEINAKNNDGMSAFMVIALQAALQINHDSKNTENTTHKVENKNPNQRWSGDSSTMQLLMDYGANVSFGKYDENLTARLLEMSLVSGTAMLANNYLLSFNPILQLMIQSKISLLTAYKTSEYVSDTTESFIRSFCDNNTERDKSIDLTERLMIGQYNIDRLGRVHYGKDAFQQHYKELDKAIFIENTVSLTRMTDNQKGLHFHDLLCHRYIGIQNKLNNSWLMPWTRRSLHNIQQEILDADKALGMVDTQKHSFEKIFENTLMIYLDNKHLDKFIRYMQNNKAVDQEQVDNIHSIIKAINDNEVIVSPRVKYLAYNFQKRYNELESKVDSPSLFSRISNMVFGEQTLPDIKLPDNAMGDIQSLKDDKRIMENVASNQTVSVSAQPTQSASQQPSFLEGAIYYTGKLFGITPETVVDNLAYGVGKVTGGAAGVATMCALDPNVGMVASASIPLATTLLGLASTALYTALTAPIIPVAVVGAIAFGGYTIFKQSNATLPDQGIDIKDEITTIQKQYKTRTKITDIVPEPPHQEKGTEKEKEKDHPSLLDRVAKSTEGRDKPAEYAQSL